VQKGGLWWVTLLFVFALGDVSVNARRRE